MQKKYFNMDSILLIRRGYDSPRDGDTAIQTRRRGRDESRPYRDGDTTILTRRRGRDELRPYRDGDTAMLTR